MTAAKRASEKLIGERMLLTGNHAASYGAMLAGNANIEAVAVQNFRNPRRVTPCLLRLSPRVGELSVINFSSDAPDKSSGFLLRIL